ncbi:hypothetical protein HFO89_36340, partial [Rhizobium leguminosarum]|nr:hypothetical protein [Rhizobium leguminosarum]
MGASVVKEAFSVDELPPEWEIEAVLAWHDENARGAIGTLLEDIRHLRRQIFGSDTTSPRIAEPDMPPSYRYSKLFRRSRVLWGSFSIWQPRLVFWC